MKRTGSIQPGDTIYLNTQPDAVAFRVEEIMDDGFTVIVREDHPYKKLNTQAIDRSLIAKRVRSV